MSAVIVFISSTCYDLLDLRMELAEYLKSHAFIVKLSDDPYSGFVVDGLTDSVTSCLQNVDSSDAVVCILDRRYGPLLKAGAEYGELSATHAELRRAQEKGKPVFTFVRDRTFLEYNKTFEPASARRAWIEGESKKDLAALIKSQKDLADAAAVNPKRSNWLDQFKTGADLRPMVLKRLLDQFPRHASAFAMQPERLVRMYFDNRGCEQHGPIRGTFINAGNGPALDVTCGWRSGTMDSPWKRQGAVPERDLIQGDGPGGLEFQCPPSQQDFALYCEYRNAAGDRYRVEAPFRWTNHGYRNESPEKLLVWAGGDNGQWLPV